MKKSILAAGLAVAVVASTVTVHPAMGETTAPAPSWAGGLTTTVTLLTGDVVHVNNGQVRTVAAEGREHVRFHHHTDERGDLHVVPVDVQQKISAGALDRRLFNVSLLTRSGYDDAERDTIPLIVQGGVGARAADAKSLPSIGAHAVTADKKGGFFSAARSAGDTRVWLDGRVTATLDRSAAQIGAPQAWQQGLTGAGTTVAVLDTGIDATHPDLQGAVVEEKNFTPAASADDRHGHGTHVASTITGDGKYKGIAPDAELINGKVLDDGGGGTESGVIAGMEWAATKADVINMSLGSSSPSDGTDLMSQAVNRLTAEHGALFVVAAGNSGAPVGSPAAADAALTVGAVERDDRLASFSSRGPRAGDGAIKPDITAPGVGIAAAKARNGVIGTPVDEGHVALSGTSMATPHVAGAAAVLAAKNSAWSPLEIKTALMNTAKPFAESSVYDQGAGRVDLTRAATASPVATPASLSLGTARWPHDDDQPITKKITYRNTGTEPLTLDLTVADQKPAVAGVFSVSPAKLTVPAGGTAEASVTADTRVAGPDGVYGAVVVASNGVRVPIGVHKEPESYDLTLDHIGHDGKPAAAWRYLLIDFEKRSVLQGAAPTGRATVRVPRGRYLLSTFFETPSGDPAVRAKLTVAYDPAVEVTADRTVTFDARTASEPSITVDRQEAAQVSGSLTVQMMTPAFGYGSGWGTDTWEDFYVHPSSTSAPEFEWTASSVLARKNADGGFQGSPYQFHALAAGEQKLPPAIRHHERERDMARVEAKFKARVPGSTGVRNNGVRGALPFELTEFYTPGVDWNRWLAEETDPNALPTFIDDAAPRTFRRGAKSTEQWNTAVFGPAFPAVSEQQTAAWAGRLGDELFVNAPLFADGTGEHSTFDFDAATGTTKLTANGRVVAESSTPGQLFTPVPPARTAYLLHADSTRPGGTSKVTADWTFTSGTVAGEVPEVLPLLAVRFEPKLDDSNQGRAGSVLTVPVTVQRNGARGDVTDVRTPQVEVSYDEGATWQRVLLFKAGGKWLVTLLHPKNAKSVSFKAKTSDRNGSVDQAVLRAYTLK
ncbi:S8 family serine peptidase [Lentzea jiangxiensis]|uniref:Serine protease, subtilisin family n=1 Tax=Lentzea jiangxiensis TaxID=641025 RepID=A0A1H0TU16_9PSEU|nr:S8 family serine peptidase [Lentzea jiangxiensis]SDP57230.1 Serine protease, subtilisin family [Lentzea jiangxiensis]